MNYARQGLHPVCRVFLCSLPCVFLLLSSTSPIYPSQWDRAAAQSALAEARRLRDELGETKNPAKEKYLQVIHTYKQVYYKDPHFSGSDDAIYECGEVYQEMGEKFGTLLYYRDAAKQYQYLLKDYETSPRCPDALLHLGDLYSGPLDDEAAAQDAYDRLRKQFKKSKAAAALTLKETAKEQALASSASTPGQGPDTGQVRIATVQNIRHWTTSDYTRVIIDLDTQTRYTKTRLDNPDRIFFDISSAKLGKELLNKTFVVSDAFLKQVRVAQNRSEVVRVVLDFATIGDYSVFELHDPYRIVVDIHGARGDKAKTERAGDTFERRDEPREKPIPLSPLPAPESKQVQVPRASSAPPPVVARGAKPPLMIEEITPFPAKPVSPETSAASSKKVEESKTSKKPATHPASSELPSLPKTPERTSRGDRTLTRMLGLKIGRIVIDPGHGGHDTGTIGRGGLMEKDLVLKVARDLKKLLEDKLGAEVILTRTDDTFISLEERTAIANQARADLFLSIHANSSSSRVTSGVETYYLDFAHNDAEREVAARENASNVRNIRDLQSLVRMLQDEKSKESRELAAILQKKLYGGARQLFPTARNRGVRSAPFVVLIGANMPSVLAEVAFISNPRDERVLKQDANRAQLAQALFAGIESYMKTLGSELARNRTGGD
jgi:N-acetylmuramoyl-L-alanine amidase